ncbi:membrane protein [Bacillus sp. SA1-12]|uniref:sulfite exporter TauE/SafE family protein n=1 Tax=Bacillus sp. SA1-12 TaxID=1455638 RepID=UPI0006265835|nr:sulfite exporter TauE/SafE family protein [Bacillus sp. SA1-12]KKI91941.1 membrane protein [Bacillus sp. SA1-12]
MRKLIIFAIVGFFAQLIDGSLGMGYGLTSTSLLMAFGVAPAVASASVHMSEIVTTAASGASHYRFGNVDKKMLIKLMIPGALGAFFGAAILSSIPGDLIKPYLSFFLMLMGIYVLTRFSFKRKNSNEMEKESEGSSTWYLVPLGAVAGFFDAVGGGGWGPINTPTLLSIKGAVPRKVIGTVGASEFAVTASATLGFLLFLGWEQLNWIWVLAFIIGGVIAAPIAAFLVRIIPSYLLGVVVGGFIILTNLNTVLNALGTSSKLTPVIYGILAFCWLFAIVWTVRNNIQLDRSSKTSLEGEI